jgi:tetratricopeptide (TPR) repeat protein
MNRLAAFTAALLLLAGVTGLLSVTAFPSDSDGVNNDRTAAVESAADRAIAQLQQRLAEAPNDLVAIDGLGSAYLQKARQSGDPAFYTKAVGLFDKALAIAPNDQAGIIGASMAAAARHDFGGARELAQQAVSIDPEDPDAQGAVGDALVELGYYNEAQSAFQKMLDARPDFNAYVRVAYLRELHGDPAGAIDAMKLAVGAARPIGETAAWVHWQLGNLYFNTNAHENAAAEYRAALDASPGYVQAVAGNARLAAARGDFDKAIELYSDVTARQPVVEYVAALGDVYRAAGRDGEAQRQYDLVGAIDELYRANGVDTDLEMALFTADHGVDPEKALGQARAAYNARPGSIRAADVLSWALYKAGKSDEALRYSLEALRLGTQDSLLLFHAGMIHKAAGDHEAARNYLSHALELNPSFSVLFAAEARTTLEKLQSAVKS